MDKAVLPIENSVAGSIHRNYDLLLRHRLHIVGEVQLLVNHCLLGLPGVEKEELKCVLSHPQVGLSLISIFYFLFGVCTIWHVQYIWHECSSLSHQSAHLLHQIFTMDRAHNLDWHEVLFHMHAYVQSNL